MQIQVKPAAAQKTPTRYSVRADDGATIKEIYVTTDRGVAIQRANRHHAKTGQKVWTWSLKTGKTIHRIERAVATAGGAQ